MELQKQQQQAELAASQANTWSALFRNANKQSASTPTLNDIQSEELKQQELIRIQQEQQAQMLKLQQQKEAQAKSIIKQSGTSWAAWSQAQQQQQAQEQINNNPNFPPPQATTTTTSTSANSTPSTGFWNETQPSQQETKKLNDKQASAKPATKQNNNQKTNSTQKSSKPAHAVEAPQNMFKSPTEEFMKWCGEQLKDFNADRMNNILSNFIS